MKCSSSCILKVLKAVVMPPVRSDFGSTSDTKTGSVLPSSHSLICASFSARDRGLALLWAGSASVVPDRYPSWTQSQFNREWFHLMRLKINNKIDFFWSSSLALILLRKWRAELVLTRVSSSSLPATTDELLVRGGKQVRTLMLSHSRNDWSAFLTGVLHPPNVSVFSGEVFSRTPTGDNLWWEHFSVGGHFVSPPVSCVRHAGPTEQYLHVSSRFMAFVWASCLCLRSFSCVSPDLYVGVDVLSWSNWRSALLLFTYWKHDFLWTNSISITAL